MKIHTEHQIITQGGKPQFVVVPYLEYLELTGQSDDGTIPHRVVELHVVEGMSLVKAWRKYKKLTQGYIADQMGITQSAYSQIEKPDSKPQKATLEKLAAVFGVSASQITEEGL